jgi:hypothetical protein
MLKTKKTLTIEGIELKVIFSGRRTLGISVLPDSSVIVRVPYLTSSKTIERIVKEKSGWIVKHRDNYRVKGDTRITRSYLNGEVHLFRGKESVLNIIKSGKPFVRFLEGTIELGVETTENQDYVKQLLYFGYKQKASVLFPVMLKDLLVKYEKQDFRPVGLIIRTMKRRWGSCSNKGIITLSTELIKLPDRFIEYVIVHELCHLKHHNHGAGYYKLLSELYPDYAAVRKELRKYIQ